VCACALVLNKTKQNKTKQKKTTQKKQVRASDHTPYVFLLPILMLYTWSCSVLPSGERTRQQFAGDYHRLKEKAKND
jgi:hypothetical protein